MSGTEGVHDVAVSIAGEGLGELLLRGLHGLLGILVGGVGLVDANGLAFLLGIEAEVLKQQGLTHLQGLGSVGSLGAVVSEGNGHAESLLDSLADLSERFLLVDLSLGLTHVRHDDHSAAVGQDLLQRGQSTADAGVVRNLTILVQGHVEVNAHDCLLTGKVHFVDSHKISCFYNCL